MKISEVKQVKKIWIATAAVSAVALYLQITHHPNIIQVAKSAHDYMYRRDAAGLADMLPEEELTETGITRAQAAQIINAIVLPSVKPLTTPTIAFSKEGNGVAFEKPRGDEQYYHPPVLALTVTGLHRFDLTLSGLLETAWGLRRQEIAASGGSNQDWINSLDQDFARLRALGYTKSFDWAHHETVDLPPHPPGITSQTAS